MHRAARRILTLLTLATPTATGWALSLNPFAPPLVERTAAEALAAFMRTMAVRVTPEWLPLRLAAAVAEDAPADVAL